LRLTHEERRLVWNSAVLRGGKLNEWCAALTNLDDKLSILHSDPPLPTERVIEALRWIDDPAAEDELRRRCLEENLLAHRQLAAERLADRGPDTSQQCLLDAARTLSRRQRQAHVATLAILYDRECLNIPTPVGLGVRRALIRLRLRRASRYTFALMVGAALGSLPLFTLVKSGLDQIRMELIGLGLACGLGIGLHMSRRHRGLSILAGAVLGGLLGGMLSGGLSLSHEKGQAIWVLLGGFLGGLWALCSAGSLLLATRRVDNPFRRMVGLAVGATGFLSAILILILIALLQTGTLPANLNVISIVYMLANPLLISIGIGLADNYATHDSVV
jgi:hypothetical protein